MDLSCGECDVISLYVYVARLMDLFVLCVACMTVFVNCLVKKIAMCLSVVAILLLNVMDMFCDKHLLLDMMLNVLYNL